MARPLKGTKRTLPNCGWFGELPTERGSRRRRGYDFRDGEDQAADEVHR